MPTLGGVACMSHDLHYGLSCISLVFHAFKLTDHSDMSQSTQLDPDEDDDDWQCASLPIEGPLEKRPRLQPEKSVVKWLELPQLT